MFDNLCEPWPFVWCGDISGVNPEVTGHAIMAASEVLWAATGRRFNNCPVTVRPCRQDCLEFPVDTRIYDRGVLTSTTWGWPFPTLVDGQFINLACGLCAGNCSCTMASEVLLPDYARIESVIIDGVSLPASGWALYDGQRLVKAEGEWPLCQDWKVRSPGVGAWSVTARFGPPLSTLGQEAVGILGLEIAKMCCGQACGLPASVIRVVRQGVSMEKLSTSDFLKEGLTGLSIPDRFITAMNPNHIMDRARAWSPDVMYPRVQS